MKRELSKGKKIRGMEGTNTLAPLRLTPVVKLEKRRIGAFLKPYTLV